MEISRQNSFGADAGCQGWLPSRKLIELKDSHVGAQELNDVWPLLLEPGDGHPFSKPCEDVVVPVHHEDFFHENLGEHFMKDGIPVRAGDSRTRHSNAVRVRCGESLAQTRFSRTGGP